jgi:hypothetical protein
MSKTTTFSTALLDLIFRNQDITLIGDAAGLQNSATTGSLYISLHTADPSAGNQTTSECAYTSYARVAVSRSTGFNAASAGATANAAAVTFPAATGGSETATYFGVGTAASGTGSLLYAAALNASLAISSGITPEFATGDLDITET